MSSMTEFVLAGSIAALIGGFLFGGVPTQRPREASARPLGVSAVAETAVVEQVQGVGSGAPVAVQPVDWATIEDAAIFGDSFVSDLAVGPEGGAVIVGFGVNTAPRSSVRSIGSSRAWSSPDGRRWQIAKLPRRKIERLRNVTATREGYVALARRSVPSVPKVPWGLILSSRDGTEWSSVAFERARFTDIDSFGDVVVVAGLLRQIPTVWTSRAGGPWEPATITERSTGFSPDQLAISADGTYLVRDRDTGRGFRSEDGLRFDPVDLPGAISDGDAHRYVEALTRAGDGFAFVLGPTYPIDPQDEDGSVTTWLSSDGLEWRRGDAVRGLALGASQLGHRAAVWMIDDMAALESDAPSTHLGFLQADGTWCAVSSPAAPGESLLQAAWNDDGSLVVTGWRERYGDPVIWQASGVRCGR